MFGKKYIVGLTGGLASGKSTIAQILIERGFDVIDADEVARDVVKPGSESLEKIVKRWGIEILNDDGSLNRKKLASIVFKDKSQRKELEKILHPEILNRMIQLAENSADEIVILVVPLLFEEQLDEWCDFTVSLTAPDEVRIERAMKKHKISREMVQDRMKTQLSEKKRNSKADYVVNTDCTIEELQSKVDNLINKILEIHNE